jgi:hypothetical protein
LPSYYIDHIHPRLKEKVHALTLCLKHLAEEGHLPSRRLQLELASDSQSLSEGTQGEPLEKHLDFVNDQEISESAASAIGSPVSATSHYAPSVVSSRDLLDDSESPSSARRPKDCFISCYTSPAQQLSEDSYQEGSNPGPQLQKTLLETVIRKTVV